LIKRLNEISDAQRFGIRPERVFRVAAAKFLMEHRHLSTIGDIAITFKQIDPWIGHLPLRNIHDGTLAPLVTAWRTRELSNRTINIVLSRVRRVLRLAAMKWRDENNLTWLETPPLLTMLNERETQRVPYPLTVNVGATTAAIGRVARLPAQDGFVQGEHGLPRTGGLLAALGLRSRGTGIRHLRVPDLVEFWRAQTQLRRQEPLRSSGCA